MIKWALTDARRTFARHHQAWDELNAHNGDHILLDSALVQASLNHLTDGPVLLATLQHPHAPAMLLLVNRGLGRWETFTPAQQPLGNALFADASLVVEQIATLQRQLPGMAMRLAVTHQDPKHSRQPWDLGDVETIERIPHIETGYVELAESFDSYWQDRPDDLRQSVARRRRRLAREGVAVTMRQIQSPDEVEAALSQYCNLEASGWKGAVGTSVDLSNTQGRFYLETLRSLAIRGEAVIYQLLYDGRPVASQICVQRGTTSVSLKIAYDDGFKRDAPGYLLQEDILRSLHEGKRITTLEFYGRATDGWTRKWTQTTRNLVHFNYYRNASVRRLLQAIKTMRRSPNPPANGSEAGPQQSQTD